VIGSEADRHRMHNRLIEALGQDVADTLMEHLPPIGWADVATRRDLDRLGIELRAEMAELRGDLRSEMANMTRALVFSVAGMMLATVGTVAALVH
jgi:hypothetical protein